MQEFEHLSFPIVRFDPALLDTLLSGAAETVEVRGGEVVLQHLFTERRLTPLDLASPKRAPPAGARAAILDFGEAIRDLAKSNIFPGDLLPKNFGLTRHGRVVFYDYDEIELPDGRELSRAAGRSGRGRRRLRDVRSSSASTTSSPRSS